MTVFKNVDKFLRDWRDVKKLVKQIPALQRIVAELLGRKTKNQEGGGGSTRRRLHIIGNRACGGCYSAYITSTAAAAFDETQSTYTNADIGTDDTSTEVTFVNLNEQGTTDHSLTAVPVVVEFVWADLAGVDINGRAKYEANIVDLGEC